MIASLTGTLVAKTPTEAVLDVHGVGYALHISIATSERLGEPGSQVTLLTHLNVREDALVLFGFATAEERSLFRLLISVSGIGPKIAQAILSGISVPDLRQHILGGNIGALTRIPNVGRKTAERMIVELKDKIGKLDVSGLPAAAAGAQLDIRSEALLALTSLGFNRTAAEKAIRDVAAADGGTLTIEELVKRALRLIGQG